MKKLFRILLTFIVINVLILPINLILWDVITDLSEWMIIVAACWWYLIMLILSYFVERDLL